MQADNNPRWCIFVISNSDQLHPLIKFFEFRILVQYSYMAAKITNNWPIIN